MEQPFAGSPIRLGVITDIQFANKTDHPLEDDHGDKPERDGSEPSPMRSYSQVLRKTASAVKRLNAAGVSATVHLGDIIDGSDTIESTRGELAAVIQTLKPLQSPLLHVLGNHCLSAGRSHLINTLQLQQTYYTRDLSDKWRMIILDSVDVNVDHDDEEKRRLAMEHLDKHAESPNAISCNGRLSSEQLAWFKNALVDTRQKDMWAIVCAHIPIRLDHGPSLHPLSAWDATIIAETLASNSDIVKAYFCGHFHEGSYAFQDNIHYVTFKAMLDSQSKEGAWAIVELYDNRILIEGHGDQQTYRLSVM